MWNETVSLYIDDTSLRLLVTSGQRVKKWADLHLEPGLVKDATVQQEAEVGERIKSLLRSQNVKTRKVVLGLSGLHSLTRPASLPQLPKSMLAEAVAREARRVLPVPLDQLYLSWRVIPGPKGRIQIYIAACPRKPVDTIMNTLKIAGLQASRMSIKPLALTKAVPVNSAILIDLQPNEFDVVIMVEGISQPVRTVSLPSEELSWEQKMKMLISDLDRTIKFYNTNNPEKPLDAKIPIYVSGELMGKPQYHKIMEEASGHPTMAVVPVFKGLEQIDAGRYMVNITMVLSPPAAGRELSFPIADLNMLPVPYQPKPMSMAKVVGIPGGAAVAGLVIPLVIVMQNTTSNITAMQEQLTLTNQIVNQKTVQNKQLKKEIVELEKQVTSSQAATQRLNDSYSAIASRQEIINGDLLLSLSKFSAGSITLTNIKESGNSLVISGSAPTSEAIQVYSRAITNYARELEFSKRFSETIVSSLNVITPPADEGSQGAGTTTSEQQINFTLTFTREIK